MQDPKVPEQKPVPTETKPKAPVGESDSVLAAKIASESRGLFPRSLRNTSHRTPGVPHAPTKPFSSMGD